MLRLRAESQILSHSEFQVDGPATVTDDHNCLVDNAERSLSADWRTADVNDQWHWLFV